jgi:dihydroxyacetone kinase phosphotransfer subunit
MVNLVLVSHSKKLAASASDMALQMIASGNVKIATAAGVGENNQDFGTNAVEIADAIQQVDSEAGVLVLMDLGSAVLSTQMALELLPDEVRARVRVCPGPFIEGAVVAAAQASAGGTLAQVYSEAINANKPKEEQFEPEADMQSAKASSEQPCGPDADSVVLTVLNEHGLHARPGVRFVQTASKFDADINVSNLTTGKGPSSAKSLTAVTFLGVLKGHQIRISATGKQKDEALQALKGLIESRFAEG